MTTNVVERAADQITDSAHRASRATSAIADVIEDGLGLAKHAVKKGGDAAEEFLDDTKQRLQRHLEITVALTLAIGIATGVVIGWVVKRK